MIILPDGYKDTDDIANDLNWKEIFDGCIKNAKDAFLQVYEMLRQKYDMTSPIDKQKIFNEMFGLIACVDNYTIQEHYKQLLSDKVWLPYEVLNAQFQKYLKTDGKFEAMKKWKLEKKISWQPDRELICVSLFWDDLFSKYISDASLYEPMFEFAKAISSNVPWDKLYKIFFDRESLDSEEKLQLDEWQLWWEKELEALSWDTKRISLIKTLVLEYLQTKLKLLLKSSVVSMEIKQKLLEDMKKI
jgi:DNA primase